MTKILTPISDGPRRFNSMRRRRRSLRGQDRIWYAMYRYYELRKHTEKWRSRGKAELTDMAQCSLDAVKATLEDWKEFHDWITAQEEQVAKANKQSFQLICGRVEDALDPLQMVVDDYADDDSALETITESVQAAAMTLGLEPYDAWAEADDGAVWFINPGTGHKHYFLLGEHHAGWKFHVMSRPVVGRDVERGDDRWKQNPAAPLSGRALVWSNENVYLRHPANTLDDYFGMYNSLGIVEKNLPASVDAALDRLSNIRRVQADS